jgi:hypothetical protein
MILSSGRELHHLQIRGEKKENKICLVKRKLIYSTAPVNISLGIVYWILIKKGYETQTQRSTSSPEL